MKTLKKAMAILDAEDKQKAQADPSLLATALTYRFNQNRRLHLAAIATLTDEQAANFDEQLLGALMTLTNPLEFRGAVESILAGFKGPFKGARKR